MKVCIGSILKYLIIGLLGAALFMNFIAIKHMRSVMRLLAAVAAEKVPAADTAETTSVEMIEEVSDAEQKIEDGDDDEHREHEAASDEEELQDVKPTPAVLVKSRSKALVAIEELPEDEGDEQVVVVPAPKPQKQQQPEPPAPASKAKSAPPNSRNKKRKRAAPGVIPSTENAATLKLEEDDAPTSVVVDIPSSQGDPVVVIVKEEPKQEESTSVDTPEQHRDHGIDAPSTEQPNIESH